MIGERPAEKDEVRPEVKKLWCVNLRHMIVLVPKNDTSVDENKCGEGGEQSDERLQDLDDIDQPLRLSGHFQRARDDRNYGFGIVCG